MVGKGISLDLSACCCVRIPTFTSSPRCSLIEVSGVRGGVGAAASL